MLPFAPERPILLARTGDPLRSPRPIEMLPQSPRRQRTDRCAPTLDRRGCRAHRAVTLSPGSAELPPFAPGAQAMPDGAGRYLETRRAPSPGRGSAPARQPTARARLRHEPARQPGQGHCFAASGQDRAAARHRGLPCWIQLQRAGWRCEPQGPLWSAAEHMFRPEALASFSLVLRKSSHYCFTRYALTDDAAI